MKNPLDLYVFYADAHLTQQCLEAGADGIIVDWEVADKRHRQSLFNTQINRHDDHTLRSARDLHKGTLICRVNGGKAMSEDEILKAVDMGATHIMLPMVKQITEVERALKAINNKAKCLVMIETTEAVQNSAEIGKLPVDGVYVGLNDLAIARNSRNIFMPMIDGTLDDIRANIPMPFGVAGLTHPNSGLPIPSHLLANELRRLNCNFTFLRRSFFKDAGTLGIDTTLSDIRRYLEEHTPYDPEKTKTFRRMVAEINTPTI